MNSKKQLTLFAQVLFLAITWSIWILNPITMDLAVSTIIPFVLVCWIFRPLLIWIDKFAWATQRQVYAESLNTDD